MKLLLSIYICVIGRHLLIHLTQLSHLLGSFLNNIISKLGLKSLAQLIGNLINKIKIKLKIGRGPTSNTETTPHNNQLIFLTSVLILPNLETNFVVAIILTFLYYLYVYIICFFEFVYYNSCPTLTGYSVTGSCHSERRIRGFKNIKKNRATKSFSTCAGSSKDSTAVVVYKPVTNAIATVAKENTAVVVYKPVTNAIATLTKENTPIRVIELNQSKAIVPYVSPSTNPIIPFVGNRAIELISTVYKAAGSGVLYLDYLSFINSRRRFELGSEIKIIGNLIFQVPYVTNDKDLSVPTTASYISKIDFIKSFGVAQQEVDLGIWSVELFKAEYNKNLRCITFKFDNPSNLSIVPFMFASLVLLFQNEEFLKFGYHKSIISTGIGYDRENEQNVTFSLHKNVFVNNSQSASTVLLNIVESGLKDIYSIIDAYALEYLKEIHIKVWNLDLYANKRIKVNKKTYRCTDLNTGKLLKNGSVLSSNSKFQSEDVISYKRGMHTLIDRTSIKSEITQNPPIPNKAFKNEIGKLKALKSIKSFGTGDIETVYINGKQIPMCISACYDGETYFFIVDKELMVVNQKEAVQNMFNEYFDFLIKQDSKVTFYHNLGRFDGRFLFECLIKYAKKEGRLENVDCLMDTSKSFINITYSYNDGCDRIIFQDSLRLFGVSLKKFCKVYNVEGKISDYKMEFNQLSVLDNSELLETLKDYSLQDSKCLYDALKKAQSIYFDNYSVDIVKALSTASLSMKIFRTQFMKKPIPILNGTTDQFVRRGYFGGATDCYLNHGKDLYYYDVNSLYPYVMKKKMPTNVVKRHVKGANIDIDNFFGYIECIVHAPDNLKNPIIPLRTKNRTIYPTGNWKGVYFTEMIKEAMKYGYKFEFVKGIEFEGEYIFDDYIDHFYKIKSDSKAQGDASLTFLAKMHLNQLYGVFGRKNESLSTLIIDNENIENLQMTDSFSTIIEIDEETSVVLLENNKSDSVRNIAQFTVEEEVSSSPYSVRSNVAIAAAVTAYGQIEMMKFKNNPEYNIYYTDTDSIFIDKPLPSHLVGNSLGQLKNETLDKYGVETINEAYFLGVKKYGYNVVKDGSTFDSSVFAGVQRDSIPFDYVEKINNGESFTVNQPSRLYNSSNDFSIIQKDSITTTITKDFHKNLIGNFYKPIKLT